MDPRPGLDGRLLVGADDVLVGPEWLALPAAAIEIEDAPGLGLELGIAREEPGAVRPGPQGVLAQPAPDGGQADRLDDLALDRLARDVGDREACQGQTEISRPLAGEGLDLDDHPRGRRSAG